MLGEFLVRLAVALPLVCGLALLLLLAVRHGWLRLPGVMMAKPPAGTKVEPVEILATKPLTPAARIMVVRFAGRELLLGVGAQGPVVLAEAHAAEVSPPPSAEHGAEL